SYTAVDLNQPSVAKVSFGTAASGTAASPTGPTNSAGNGKTTTDTSVIGSKSGSSGSTSSDPVRGTLDGTVSAAGNVKLALKGKVVSSLKYGQYTLVVTDSSSKSGFVLQQNKKAATTIS